MKAWAVISKRTGKVMYWADREGRDQYDFFRTRDDARKAAKEWFDNTNEICRIKQVTIELR